MDFTKIARALIAVTAFTAACVLQTGAAAAKWLRAESPNFIVYGEMTEAELRERVNGLEHFHQATGILIGLRGEEPSRKAEVYLTPTASFGDVLQVRAEGVLGFYAATPETAAFVSTVDGYKQELRYGGGRIKQVVEFFGANHILQHEYTHHLMFQYFNRSYPAWYREGLAEYVSTLIVEPGRVKIGEAPTGRLWSLSGNNWVPARRFMTVGDKASLEELNAIYAQGWLAVHYFHSSKELTAALNSYLGGLNQGKDPEATAMESFGMSFGELDKAMRSYMRGKVVMRIYEGWTPGDPEITVTEVSPGYADVLLLDLGARMGQGRYARRLKSLRETFQKHPEDELVRLALARSLIGAGEWSEALATLDAVGDDPGALVLRGHALLAKARKAEDDAARAAAISEARKHFARASKLDPNNVPALAGYAATLGGTAAYSENAINVRLLAYQLAPQVDQLAVEAAWALMMAERFEEAAPLLQPVANTPHTRRYTKYAGALLEAADARQAPPDYATWVKQQKAKGVKVDDDAEE